MMLDYLLPFAVHQVRNVLLTFDEVLTLLDLPLPLPENGVAFCPPPALLVHLESLLRYCMLRAALNGSATGSLCTTACCPQQLFNFKTMPCQLEVTTHYFILQHLFLQLSA